MSNHLAEAVMEMIHSRPGALVSLASIAYGTPKDRKRLVKSMKGYVSKICTEPDGHMLMMALWDVVDDTVLLKESILKELLTVLDEVLVDRCGQRVILYLMAPEAARYYPADVTNLLKEEIPAGAAKKDPAKRRQELLPHLVPSLIEFCTEHPELSLVPGGADIIFEVAKQVEDATGMMEAVAAHLAGVDWVAQAEEEEGGKAAYAAAKRLLAASNAKGDNAGLVEAMSEAVKGKAVKFSVDGGGFLLAAVVAHEEAKKALQAELKKGAATLKKAGESAGCAVLLKAMK